MFNEEPKKPGGNGSFDTELEESIYLMNHVPLVRHSVMGYFQKFKLDNRDAIEMALQQVNAENKTGSSSKKFPGSQEA